jgi:hypothetical protein
MIVIKILLLQTAKLFPEFFFVSFRVFRGNNSPCLSVSVVYSLVSDAVCFAILNNALPVVSMRFRDSRTPPPFLNAKDKNRILRLVGLLILILIAMKVAAKPKTWSWLFPQQPSQQNVSEPGQTRSPETIDFRVRLEEQQLKPGEFRSRPGTDVTNQKVDSQTRNQTAADLLEIGPSLLSVVKDNTLGVRHFERDAYYALLTKARDSSARFLEQAAMQDVAYEELMLNPDEFRGKPITIEGEAARLWKLPVTKNEFGFDDLYEAWIVTSDSGNRPYRVVCTRLPAGIPLVEKTSKPIRVKVTGFFFKKEGYQAEGGLTVAPLLLADTLKWYRPKALSNRDQAWAPYLVVSVLFIGSILGLIVWRTVKNDNTFRGKHLKRITAASPESIEALNGIPTIEPEEMFRQIAEQVKQAESQAVADSSFSEQDQSNSADET